MLTLNDVKQINSRLSMENTDISEENLSEDISRIVFRKDVYECGDATITDRHIDIEYSFGEYFEVREGSSLFQYICQLYNLPLWQEEQDEIIIYRQS